MAELIGALVEAFAGLMMAVAEALPAILETLAYVAAGAITIIAYALSRRFRERKRQEWKHRPKSRYLELGIGSVCLGLLVAWRLGFSGRTRGQPRRAASPGSRRASMLENCGSQSRNAPAKTQMN